MTIKQLLIWAIVIRLLIAPFMFHPDIKGIHLRVSFLQKGVINIYEFLQSNEVTRVNAPDFVYPPLAYFSLGLYQFMATPLLGEGFNSWLFDFSGNAPANENIFRYLLILKLPYFVFDFLVAYLLVKLVPNEKKKLVLFFWLFNPLNLYAVYAIGQFDIVPSALTFLSYYLWERNSVKSSGLALGLASSFKAFPLLLIPAFLFTGKKLKGKIIFAIISLGLYGISILPFINSMAFQKNFLFSSLSQRIFELQIHFFNFSLSIFLIIYLILLTIFFKRRHIKLWSMILSILLLVFAVTRFHPQWIVWLTPFLALAVSALKLKVPVIFYILSFFIIFLFFGDKFLLYGLLSPISLSFLEIPEINTIFSVGQISFAQAASRVIFVALSALITVKALKYR